MTARKHHYLPQCYLKGFARRRDKAQLYVVDAERPKPFRTAPSNVAAERDFHRIDVEGQPPDLLENRLSHFEAELADALVSTIKARSIGHREHFACILNLIGLCAVKNPRQRRGFANFHEQTLNLAMDAATSTPEIWAAQMAKARADGFLDDTPNIDDEDVRLSWRKDSYKIETPVMIHLQLEFGVFDKVLETLFARRWTLLKAPRGQTGFICSDHPMSLIFSDPKKRAGPYGVGHGLLGTEILFPLSNELALLGTYEGPGGEVDFDSDLIAHTNYRTAMFAGRQIYARDADFLFWADGKIKSGLNLTRETLFRRSQPLEET